MTPDLFESLAARAREFLAAAEQSHDAGRHNAAYEEARTAAELACKALLHRALGSYPREHDPSGALKRHRLVPGAVHPHALSRFLRNISRGAYGMETPVARVEAKEALVLASQMVSALVPAP